jgi:hypothetical protein
MVASQKTGVDNNEFQNKFSNTSRLLYDDVIVGVNLFGNKVHSGSDFWEAALQSMLNLCSGPPFPRTISTYKTEGRQIKVYNVKEMFKQFELSQFLDCRINAFPRFTKYKDINMQPPTFIMCDLDIMKFRTERQLLQALDETIENIGKDIKGVPMVLFTGNGYHVYQPIELPVLEQESIFSKFHNPSTEFIRYSAQKWTNGKNDPSNHPSVNSCLLRVPGSTNSKNNRMVEVVQEWDGNRPAANRMLAGFYLKLAAKELAYRSKQRNYYYQSKFMKKNYRHYGHTIASPVRSIAWIENVINNCGIADYRKLFLDLVLAPYLINVRNYGYETAYAIIALWLDKCGRRNSLRFNAKYKARYVLNRSRQTMIKPMNLETMRRDYPDMYKEINLYCGL